MNCNKLQVCLDSGMFILTKLMNVFSGKNKEVSTKIIIATTLLRSEV